MQLNVSEWHRIGKYCIQHSGKTLRVSMVFIDGVRQYTGWSRETGSWEKVTGPHAAHELAIESL